MSKKFQMALVLAGMSLCSGITLAEQPGMNPPSEMAKQSPMTDPCANPFSFKGSPKACMACLVETYKTAQSMAQSMPNPPSPDQASQTDAWDSFNKSTETWHTNYQNEIREYNAWAQTCAYQNAPQGAPQGGPQG